MQISKLISPSLATLSSLAISLTATQVMAVPVANHIGGGIRAGFRDDTAFILNGKVKLTDLGDVSLSGRPTVLFGDEVELRLAITGEGELAPNLSPFIGGGIAVNTDGTGDSDPLLAFGAEYQIDRQLVIQVGGNILFKSNDTDTEFTVTANYAF